MSIPDFQSLMRPVLQFISDGREHSIKDIRDHISTELNLNPDQLSEKLASGTGVFTNRVAWAVVKLKMGGAVESVDRGIYRIRQEGMDLLTADQPITLKALHSLEPPMPSPTELSAATLTPEEELDKIARVLKAELAEELLVEVRKTSPQGFEQLVVDLLLAMGYGGALETAGEVVGKAGDGGIDGTIKQDKLGLEMVYIQAKQCQDPVGSPHVMKFCGGLAARHATKGVMLTTSQFTKDAVEYVTKIPHKIVLLNGKQLAELMIEHNLGVKTKNYEVKRLDQDYFDEL